MKSFAVAAVAALATVATARQCQNLTVPVTISARNGVFNVTTPVSNIDVTNFILNLSQQGGNYSQDVLTGYETVSGTYNLAATHCTPDAGPAKVLQILTHGIGFDRSYWDLAANNYNYSYVNEAVEHCGYSTFSYDRLGIGMSQRGEPVNEIQAYLEIAALQAVTQAFRQGTVASASGIRYDKIVLVGHSFGSIQSAAIAAAAPTLADGLVLTGFSANATFVPFFQLGGNFVQANSNPALASYVNGYLAAGNPSAVQTNFFSPGQFDPQILALAAQTGQPVTVGELLTLGGAGSGVAQNFKGPVLVVTGGRDIPFCGGDCLATGDPAVASIPAGAKMVFPSASVFQATVIPEAGHGLNLEYSHPTTYSTITSFLEQNGLGAQA